MAPQAFATASELYPSLLRFLQENGLAKTAKAFRKEAEVEEEAEENAPELLQLVREGYAAVNSGAVKGEKTNKKKKKESQEDEEEEQQPVKEKKKRKQPEEPEQDAQEEQEEPAPKKKKEKKKAAPAEEEEEAEAEEPETVPKKKKDKKKTPPAEEEAEEEAQEETTPKTKKETKAEESETQKTNGENTMKQNKKGAKPKGVPFQREDWDKWTANIKDDRLKDNSHLAKKGDSWADKASEDLLKVRGKGFRKEMAKKKKASWRGGGMLDMGVNSIRLDDSDSD